MKYFTLLFIALSGILGGCKKDKSDAVPHITATVDGKPISFNVNATAGMEVLGFWDYFIITGASDSTKTQSIKITMSPGLSPQYIKTGTYTDTGTLVPISGVLQDGSSYLTGSYIATNAGSNTYNHFVLHIAALDDKIVRGTFSGDFFINGVNSDKKTITNGDFYIKRQQ